jgi:ribosome maturation factor RimP
VSPGRGALSFLEVALTVSQTALEGRLAALVESLGCELVGVETRNSVGNGLVRIYIDTPNGVTVDDCERVSRQVSALLDVEEPMRGAYTLEVSSPGLDRPLFTLEHYLRFRGQRIRLSFTRLLNGRRHLTGVLLEANEQSVVVVEGEQRFEVPFAAIARGRLVPDL